MVKIKEPVIGEDCRTIAVDGSSDYANPKRIRISLYTIRMGMPEREQNDQILQLAREGELVLDRNVFLKFAERIASLKNWIEEHPIEGTGMDDGELKKFISEKFRGDEIAAIWLGVELEYSESLPMGMMPLMTDKEKK